MDLVVADVNLHCFLYDQLKWWQELLLEVCVILQALEELIDVAHIKFHQLVFQESQYGQTDIEHEPGSEGEDVIAGEGTPAAPAPAGNAITTKAPGAFATRAPGSSVFDDCALERVSTLQAAMECTEKLEATYASIEAGGGSKDERDAKLSLASDLINKIARKAEAFPHGAEDR